MKKATSPEAAISGCCPMSSYCFCELHGYGYSVADSSSQNHLMLLEPGLLIIILEGWSGGVCNLRDGSGCLSWRLGGIRQGKSSNTGACTGGL